MELTYSKNGDYYLPDLCVLDTKYEIGKYGMMRQTYLKNHRPRLYAALLTNGTLLRHLEDTDQEAKALEESIVSKMAKANGATEELKTQNPLQRTGLMNNYKHSAEEIIKEMLFD